jgi:hypothetical protein
MTTAFAPTRFPLHAAARKSFYAKVRGGLHRKKRLFFQASGSAILAQWPDFAKNAPPTASEQLEALLGQPWPFPGRPPKHDLSTWTVTDDWPEHIPVTEAEVDVFEAWFGDLFDELFGSCR